MKYKYIILSAIALLSQSCNDFLEREPIDFGNEHTFFQNAEELKYFVNDLYDILPTNNALWGGLYTEDIVSDNQCASYAQNLFYKGDKKTVQVGQSGWNFANIRSLNFFINKVEGKIKEGTFSEGDALVNHYLGEAYFLRAYDYFRLLRSYGDVPVFTEVLPDDQAVLSAKSQRTPRNEVARFILGDLDRAVSLLLAEEPETGRISRDAAHALKSRVALYEATWERYHAGTCFVPGNTKWPGAAVCPDFTFKAGSAEDEVNYFLDQAIAASKAVCDARPLLCDDYQVMFCSTDTLSQIDEVILARYYQKGILAHSCSAFLRSGGGCNLTRAAVNTFLMTNGLPIYAGQSGYRGDSISYYEFMDRDPRLTGSVRPAGRLINTSFVDGEYVNDTIYYYRPYIYNSGREKSTTGYELCKWLSSEEHQQIQYDCTTAVPILRVGECYLNYIEAYYERYGTIDDQAVQYWKALRRRAGVSEDIEKTIAATDVNLENDLGIYSHGQTVSPTLYSIRRERRCELIAEGLRLDDLKRWRSLDNMVQYQPEGINLWDKMYEMYGKAQIDENLISQAHVSKYIRPLQISSTSVAYDGYTFPKPHYLEPIPISEFLLVESVSTGKLYQNPGWPDKVDGTADYDYDCD
ncbi:MAG: RagB/SusD family nutrient uptake outer membrane protein [Bacteroidaceae bacterium]|nr:RagB/SusD family nutrient uptake outer membrane protein [Bacteroidaceae bacterium]